MPFLTWRAVIAWRAAAPCSRWSLANFQAVFGNLTGEDARPTMWRGRPRPRPGVRTFIVFRDSAPKARYQNSLGQAKAGFGP